MFTGIVEAKGQVRSIEPVERGVRLVIQAPEVMGDVALGDSIAVNGICLTVVAFDERYFAVDVMQETLDRTAFQVLDVGSSVNVERAMQASDRFGGHIVSGHIDGTGILERIEADGIANWYHFSTSPEILRYIVMKGSISIDGTSLTIAGLDDGAGEFSVSIIPHTASQTLFGEYEVGRVVNLENDLIGKYVERLLEREEI
ncbi:riboflavin synthase [Suicoccus acidiformans]|uniref:Riboflavin synthase n=1 Tax=Suicoccus acidiformans TaxID=2036206 RepID=A0A347WI44_9LACT|nr:riboflavin synthase [Suicoccus acidiformans]AXY24751.1 riboflavin synthase [Suicoccus acidiformans]